MESFIVVRQTEACFRGRDFRCHRLTKFQILVSYHRVDTCTEVPRRWVHRFQHEMAIEASSEVCTRLNCQPGERHHQRNNPSKNPTAPPIRSPHLWHGLIDDWMCNGRTSNENVSFLPYLASTRRAATNTRVQKAISINPHFLQFDRLENRHSHKHHLIKLTHQKSQIYPNLPSIPNANAPPSPFPNARSTTTSTTPHNAQPHQLSFPNPYHPIPTSHRTTSRHHPPPSTPHYPHPFSTKLNPSHQHPQSPSKTRKRLPKM